jgi:hypothetical protein
MPDATPSRDGKYRVDLKIKHRLDLNTLARLLASTANDGDFHGDLPTLSHRQTRDRIRGVLASSGRDSLISWGDGLEDEERNHTLGWAMEQVARAYPELAAHEPADLPGDTVSKEL